jgi:integrase
MFKQDTHPKIVQERLGHSSIQVTLDTYSHIAPGMQEAAADRFGKLFDHKPENEVTAKFG